ncbi:MAG: hypothetical protein ACLQBJ_07655 [Bryobacteraceae bacterium]
MECHEFDFRGYALGELPVAEAAECERHCGACEQCRLELGRWQATLAAVQSLPQVEPPRRIVFVSDPILPEPWWRRMWKAGPQLGFASAAMLSLAIVTHGVLARPPAATAPAPQAAIEAAAQREVERRVQAEMRPVVAEMARQLNEREKLDLANYEQRAEKKRETDLQAIRYAFEKSDQRLNFILQSASRRSGGE